MKALTFNFNLLVGFVILWIVHDSNGMFECILTHLEITVKNNSYADFGNLKIGRFNRTTFVLNGTFELFVDSIDDINAICRVFKKAGNEYKLTPYKIGPTNVCEVLSQDEFSFYTAVHAVSENFPPLGTCNFTKGKIYKIINFLPKLDNVPPVFQSGDYMTECQVSKKDELFETLKIYGQIYNIASVGGMNMNG